MDPAKKSTSDTDEKFESLFEIGKRLDDIKKDFDEKYKKWGKQIEPSSQHGNMSRDGDSSTPRNSTSTTKKGRPKSNCVETEPELPDHEIHGFENEILFLKNFLVKPKESKEFKTLAIVGKYGVGKTTLCQSVFNDAEVKRAYLPRIWVSMYNKETKEDEDQKIDVLKRILGSLGVEDETLKYIKTEAEEEKRNKDEAGEKEEETVEVKELSRLLNALHLNLIGKKYLIVLDDVCEDNKWNERLDGEKKQQDNKSHLSCGFPKEFGGRVIVTTRDKSLGKKMVGEEENLQLLFPRSDAKSIWKIYEDAALLTNREVQILRMKVRLHAQALLDANRFINMDKAGDTVAADVGNAKDGNAVAADAGNAKALRVNPRYPGRFKQELMDKSCGVPLAARMLAEIKPVEMEDKEANMDRKKSF